MKIDLTNQVVLITGASRGIGEAIARVMASAGASVAIHFNRRRDKAERLKEDLGPDAHIFQADLNKPEACANLIERVYTQMGRIDVLVNNAGIVRPIAREAGWEEAFAAWSESLQVNLIASGLLCHTVIPKFQRQGGGRIIHISSRAAFRGDTPEYMAYAASKGGMVSLSRSIARYFGKDGIKSFIVAPGFTRTDMAQEFIDTYGEEIVLNGLALDHLTEPADVAPAVLFLASGYMDHATGCTIDINAGSYVR